MYLHPSTWFSMFLELGGAEGGALPENSEISITQHLLSLPRAPFLMTGKCLLFPASSDFHPVSTVEAVCKPVL